MARTRLRLTAAVGALGLGLLAMSPASCRDRTTKQGPTPLTIKLADQDAQGTGTRRPPSTRTARRPRPGRSSPPSRSRPRTASSWVCSPRRPPPAPTARPRAPDSPATARAAITIGDSSCLTPGDNITGSLGSLDLKSLLSANSASAITDALSQVPGSAALLAAISGGQASLTTAIQQGLDQAAGQFGDSGLVVDLGMIEGRCTADGRQATGSATLDRTPGSP